jgi:dTDP-4-amino-4,6-dideoxygalactose transaminase
VLQRAWDKQWLTNRGELVLELEEKLKEYLSVKNVLVTNNGTVPLQIALKLLGHGGEIITTPFSYVASTAAIVGENCTGVCGYSSRILNIDETKIEAAITSRTAAILATHVFGNPCAVEAIEKIARQHQLAVIYDGAHAFGVQHMGRSLLSMAMSVRAAFTRPNYFIPEKGVLYFVEMKPYTAGCTNRTILDTKANLIFMVWASTVKCLNYRQHWV